MGASKQYQQIITQGASDDIFDLHVFYEEMQIGLGDEFMDAVGNCLLDIEENPYRCNMPTLAMSESDGH